MTALANPALAMACAAGVLEGLLDGRSVADSTLGTVPSITSADYATYVNVANAVAIELDGQLGAGYDVLLASNATPGITVGATTAAAGTDTLSLLAKPLAMSRIAASFFRGRASVDVTSADWLAVAKAIKAAYGEGATVVYANAS